MNFYFNCLCSLNSFLLVLHVLFLSSHRMFSIGISWTSSHFPLKYLHTPNCGTVHTLIQRDIQCLMLLTLCGVFYFHYQYHKTLQYQYYTSIENLEVIASKTMEHTKKTSLRVSILVKLHFAGMLKSEV